MINFDPLLQIEQQNFRAAIAHILNVDLIPSHRGDVSPISLPQNVLDTIPTRDLDSTSTGRFWVVPGCLDDVNVSLACTCREGMRESGGW